MTPDFIAWATRKGYLKDDSFYRGMGTTKNDAAKVLWDDAGIWSEYDSEKGITAPETEAPGWGNIVIPQPGQGGAESPITPEISRPGWTEPQQPEVSRPGWVEPTAEETSPLSGLLNTHGAEGAREYIIDHRPELIYGVMGWLRKKQAANTQKLTAEALASGDKYAVLAVPKPMDEETLFTAADKMVDDVSAKIDKIAPSPPGWQKDIAEGNLKLATMRYELDVAKFLASGGGGDNAAEWARIAIDQAKEARLGEEFDRDQARLIEQFRKSFDLEKSKFKLEGEKFEYGKGQDILAREFQEKQEERRLREALANAQLQGLGILSSARSQAESLYGNLSRYALAPGQQYALGYQPGGVAERLGMTPVGRAQITQVTPGASIGQTESELARIIAGLGG